VLGPSTPISRGIVPVRWAFGHAIGLMSCLFSCSRNKAVRRRTNHSKLVKKFSRGQIGLVERSPNGANHAIFRLQMLPVRF
jgi:hypothetical protein